MDLSHFDLQTQRELLGHPNRAAVLTDEAIVERYPAVEYRYGRWDRKFGAWRVAGSIDQFVPKWRLFSPKSAVPDCLEALPADVLYELYSHEGDLIECDNDGRVSYTPTFRAYLATLPSQMSTDWDGYRSLIPPEINAAVSIMSEAQWLALEGIWHSARFADFLLPELMRHGPYYVELIYSLAQANGLNLDERLSLNARIIESAPCRLLGEWLHLEITPEIFKLIMRIKPRPSSLEIRSFVASLVDRRVREFASRCRHIPKALALILGEFPACLMTPRIAALIAALVERQVSWDYFAVLDLRSCLHDLETIPTSTLKRLAPKLEACSSLTEFQDQVASLWETKANYLAWLNPQIARARLRSSLHRKLPRPPHPGTKLLRPLQTRKAIAVEGWQMEHCAVQYLPRIAEYEAYLYAWHGRERATVLVNQLAGQWSATQIVLKSNRKPSVETEAEIDAALRKDVNSA